MCFSATASFVAGVSLSALGVAIVKKAERKAEIPFAMIPFLFGVQQIIEGMLWLSFRFDAPDPVCKMNVEPGKAAAKAEHAGQVYYFCSSTCHKAFVAEPEKYASGAAPADHSCCGGHK